MLLADRIDDDVRGLPAPDVRPGTREWWERYRTEALEALKQQLEGGE